MRNLARTLEVFSLSLCFVLQPAIAQTQSGRMDSDEFFRRVSQPPPARDHSQKIEALLKRMTLEEKIGQMTQLAIGMIASGTDQNLRVDPAKLEKAVVKYGVGSILNVADQAM